tara:strand:+ start:1167 stop:1682 length:516 start_codon:yes stop_codon:yes gene_type:complete
MPVLNDFEVPIPGQSLAGSELGTHAWENPPDFPSPDDAFKFMMDRVMGDEDILAGIVDCLERGMFPETIVDAMLLNAFMVGQITPDVSIILREPLLDLILLVGKEGDVDIKRADDEQIAAKQNLASEILAEMKAPDADTETVAEDDDDEQDDDTPVRPTGMMAPPVQEPEE